MAVEGLKIEGYIYQKRCLDPVPLRYVWEQLRRVCDDNGWVIDATVKEVEVTSEGARWEPKPKRSS